MSDLLPGVTQCTTCPHLMRPYRTSPTDYPGTVSRVNNTTCMSCAARKRNAAKQDSDAHKAANNNSGLNAFMTARRNRLTKLNRQVLA